MGQRDKVEKVLNRVTWQGFYILSPTALLRIPAILRKTVSFGHRHNVGQQDEDKMLREN